MTTGDLTLTDHGVYEVSSASLKAAVDNINISTVSGGVHFVSVANGMQIAVLEVEQA